MPRPWSPRGSGRLHRRCPRRCGRPRFPPASSSSIPGRRSCARERLRLRVRAAWPVPGRGRGSRGANAGNLGRPAVPCTSGRAERTSRCPRRHARCSLVPLGLWLRSPAARPWRLPAACGRGRSARPAAVLHRLPARRRRAPRSRPSRRAGRREARPNRCAALRPALPRPDRGGPSSSAGSTSRRL